MKYHRYKDLIVLKPSSVAVLAFLSLLLWYDLFIETDVLTLAGSMSEESSPIAQLLLTRFSFCNWPAKLASMGIMLSVAFLMIWINEEFSFISVRTVIPSFLFVIITSLAMRPHCLTSGYVVALLMAFALYCSFRLVESDYVEHAKWALNVGMLLSFASLLSFSTVSFIVLFWVFLYRCNALSLKSFISSLIGVALVWFYETIFFVWMGDPGALGRYVTNWFSLSSFVTNQDFSLPSKIYSAVLAVILVVSVVKTFLIRSQQNTRTVEQANYLMLCLCWSFFLLALHVVDIVLLFPTFVLFASYVMGQFFSVQFTRFSRILMGAFVLSSLLFVFFPA